MSQRILLVDDEPVILLTLKAILEMNGFEAVTAPSAAEAKCRLQTDSFLLVITELKMEKETSGLDVARFAREQRYRPAVAILTAYPDVDSDWKEQEAENLWIKPMNMPDLLERIEALLAQRQIITRRKKPSIVAKRVHRPAGATTT